MFVGNFLSYSGVCATIHGGWSFFEAYATFLFFFNMNYYRPQGKVMFSEAYVILSPRWVGQTPSRGKLPPPEANPLQRQTPSRGSSGGTDIEWRPLQRPVHILRILVFSASSKKNTSDSCMSNKLVLLVLNYLRLLVTWSRCTKQILEKSQLLIDV